ncbi:MAG: cobalamin-dependent protein [Deltaproteobacteria bacterium]|nr:cobalamin-dependent protein [Deltaproteobacteria bacterium]MBW1820109.1 cobalamin-dependent protein [Deltaproteobacteria bacterium]MBW2284822.1 cobalamin-dependent protein [Deltaproteobacteria bacterium]
MGLSDIWEKHVTEKNRKIKAVIGKTALDGHWRGVQAVATALRDAGMEVVYLGASTAEGIVKVALQEDADVIGLNIGASYEQVAELIRLLGRNDMQDLLLIVGGVIPLTDVPKLEKMGVHGVFPPGSKLDDIVRFIQGHSRVVSGN